MSSCDKIDNTLELAPESMGRERNLAIEWRVTKFALLI